MGEIIYSKYSNDRAPEYMIATDIIREEKQKVIKKRAMNKSAVRHIKSMKEHYNALSNMFSNTKFAANKIIEDGGDYLLFEYIEGEGLEQKLDKLLYLGEYDELIYTIRVFFDELNKLSCDSFVNSETFEHFFGSHEGLSEYRCIPVGNVDLIFQNVVIGRDDVWNVIDYEWTLDCKIPVKFLEYRSIFIYIYSRSNRSVLIEKNLFGEFGLTGEEMKMFADMEEHFQNTIKACHKNLGDYYQYMGMPAANSQVSFEKNENLYMNVFLDNGSGLYEFRKTFSEHNARLLLERDTKVIRIEPASMDCIVRIDSICDNKGNPLEYSINGRKLEDNSFLIAGKKPCIMVDSITEDTVYLDIALDVKALDAREAVCLDAKLEKMIFENERLYNELNDVYNSVSWKLTQPMRSVGKVLFAAKNGSGKGKKPSVVRDGLKYLSNNGFRSTVRRTIEFCRERKNILQAENFKLTKDEIDYQINYDFEYRPLISILVPLYNTPDDFLREMIDSVVFQTYSEWELCLADGSDSEHSYVGDVCREYSDRDKRIVYKHLEENRGISDNTNECMKMATGDFIGLFDHDDLLTQNALFEVVFALNEDRTIGALYTDEDKYLYDSRKKTGKFVQPFFKPDFNLDLLRSCNYICHFFVVKRSIAEEVGGFRRDFDGSQDFDFIFRCSEKAERVCHVPKILYHWRIHANSTAASPENKMYCYEAGRHAIEEHLKRNGITAEVEITQNLGYYRVKYPISGEPLVSIIIYNKDDRKVLQRCIDSIISKSTYKNYEIIIVDNKSETDDIRNYYSLIGKSRRIHVDAWDGETNYSDIINYGVSKSKGEYILLLHSDTEVISEDWISEMLANCQRSDVGVVGAKLLYHNNTVQHCGKVIGLNGIAGNVFEGMDVNHIGYSGRALAQQNLSAVTSACMMTSRELFDKLGGFEQNLGMVYNDVDYCLRVREAGYLVVLNTYVRLFHNELRSKTSEISDEERTVNDNESRYMSERWKDILEKGDPYYNRNLTLRRGDFSMRDKDE